ncbi:MAG: adenylate/guanylate cyclase domain-containing protein [Pseudomonadota bacterium]
MPETAARSTSLNLDGLAEATIRRGLEGHDVEEQLSAFAEQVRAAGVPIKRVSMGMTTLHPQFGALTYVWRPGAGRAENAPQQRDILQSEAFKLSPIKYLLESGQERFRQRLDIEDPLPFPVLEEIRDEGMTDYAACLIRFGSDSVGDGQLEGVFFSCATDVAEGLDAGHINQVLALLPHLALAVKARLTYDVAKTVAQTYLGEDAGKRVLTGEIVRGSTRSIDAVIWFCDLRGFTGLAGQVDQAELIELLDAYLETMARPVKRHQGQILKFMGDGFLATFQLTDADRSEVSRRALSAALELRAEYARFNQAREAAGEPVLGFGLSLHVGEVLYGNIGADERLDFTVVGPAVNVAARVQDLCRPLGKDVLVSSAFYDAVGRSDVVLEPLGVHTLRGVDEARELFTVPAD